jgi:putative antirepressor
MSNLKIFENSEFGGLRVEVLDGNPIFCLKDVMAPLGLTRSYDVRERLDESGIYKVKVKTGGGTQELTFISEPNFYRCVMQSKKPEAERFQSWVVEDVLPTIRKTGMYMGTELAKKILDDPKLLSEIFMNFAREKELLEKKIEEAKPKVEYFDNILNSRGRMIPTEVAKSFGLGPKDLLKLLISVGVLRRVRNHVDFTCKYENKGYGSVYDVECGTDDNGNPTYYKQFKFSEKGKSAIHKALKKAGVIISPDDSKTVRVDKNKIKELIEKFDSKYENDYFLS